MDATKHLLRRAVYLFYPPPAAVILETLIHHGVLFEDDLVKLCQLHRKVLRAHAANLLHDKLITAHFQKEDYQGRLFSRTYYYIHFIEAIDAIKWKVHCIVKQMKEDIGALSEPQGYVCPTCNQKYTLLDAASLLSDDGLQFECSLCGDGLVDDDISQEQRKGQEKLEKLMALLEPIIKYLKDIDDDVIEDNNFESSLIKAIPAFANSLASYSLVSAQQAGATGNKNGKDQQQNNNNSYYAPSGPPIHKNSNADAVEAAKRGDATIHVSITADDEDLKRERAKREQRNEKLRQNALPSWHQSSTVGEKELGRLDGEEERGVGAGAGAGAGAEEDNDQYAIAIKKENANSNANANDTHLHSTTETAGNNNNNTIIDENTNSSTSFNIKTNDDVNAEEMNALSAYYEQLKQRQEKEDAEDEEMWDMDEWQGSNDTNSTSPIESRDTSNTNDKQDSNIGANNNTTPTPTPPHDNKSTEVNNEDLDDDDLDEDDIDLDMFD